MCVCVFMCAPAWVCSGTIFLKINAVPRAAIANKAEGALLLSMYGDALGARTEEIGGEMQMIPASLRGCNLVESRTFYTNATQEQVRFADLIRC